MNKDLGGATPFFTNMHPCLDRDDVSTLYDDPIRYTGDGTQFRIGPGNGPGQPEDVMSTGTNLLTSDWTGNSGDRAVLLSILTSGTHSDSDVASAQSYFVDIDYNLGADEVLAIPVPLDSTTVGVAGNILDSDGGAAGTCNLAGEDLWCIVETGDAVGSSTISCDANDDDEGHLWKVIVALDDTREINSIVIS